MNKLTKKKQQQWGEGVHCLRGEQHMHGWERHLTKNQHETKKKKKIAREIRRVI